MSRHHCLSLLLVYELRPQFVSCDHLSVCRMTSCCDFLFLVAIVLIFYLHMFQFYVATSRLYHDLFCCPFLFFWSQPKFFVATNFLLPICIPGYDLKVMSRPHVALFLAACSLNCSKVVATLISSAQLFFRSRPK